MPSPDDYTTRRDAINAWVDKWAAWVDEQREAGETIPSWRVVASVAFHAGADFERDRQAKTQVKQ